MIQLAHRTILIDSCRVLFDSLAPSGRSSSISSQSGTSALSKAPAMCGLYEIAVGSIDRKTKEAWPVPSASRADASHHRLDPKVLRTTAATSSASCTYTRLARTSYSGRVMVRAQWLDGVWHDRLHRCHRPMSLPPSEVGRDFVARGHWVAERKASVREAIPHAGRLPTGPWAAFFRGCLPPSTGEHYSAPIIIAVAEAVPVWKLPPRLMGDYERICKGILQADKAEQAELIQKRQRWRPILDQSGLLSWPIFAFARRWS